MCEYTAVAVYYEAGGQVLVGGADALLQVPFLSCSLWLCVVEA